MLRNPNLANDAQIALSKIAGSGLGSVFGKTFYVNSGSARKTTNTGGGSIDRPFSTLASALAAIVAGRGSGYDDTIILAPGHSETITGAAGINIATAGLTIIGVGEGSKRPEILFSTSTSASFDINAAAVTLTNVRIQGTGIDALTAMINVKAADFRMSRCVVRVGNSTNQATLGILTDANASRMIIEDSLFIGAYGVAGTTTCIRLVGGTDIIIRRNTIEAACGASNGCIEVITTDATNLSILDNHIFNNTSGTSLGVVLANSTGIVSGNRVLVRDADASPTIGNLGTVTEMFVCGNHVSSAKAQASVLV